MPIPISASSVAPTMTAISVWCETSTSAPSTGESSRSRRFQSACSNRLPGRPMRPPRAAPIASTTSGPTMLPGDSWMWCLISSEARDSPEKTRK